MFNFWAIEINSRRDIHHTNNFSENITYSYLYHKSRTRVDRIVRGQVWLWTNCSHEIYVSDDTSETFHISFFPRTFLSTLVSMIVCCIIMTLQVYMYCQKLRNRIRISRFEVTVFRTKKADNQCQSKAWYTMIILNIFKTFWRFHSYIISFIRRVQLRFKQMLDIHVLWRHSDPP